MSIFVYSIHDRMKMPLLSGVWITISGTLLRLKSKTPLSFEYFSPIHDLKNLLIPLGVKFMDKSLSYSCQRTRTCFSPLRVLNRKNGHTPTEDIARKFVEFYKNQIEMNLVDAFICFHPAAMCELYMPFNRSMIVIASTRYEASRFDNDHWKKWNENLIQISRHPRNVIAANNLYDAEYIRYFTGINATVLPSFCNYTNSNYQPKRSEFLLGPIHEQKFDLIFQEMLQQSLERSANIIEISPIRKIYRNYQYSDLTNHPAIVHVPYQVSVMSFFEQYRMNIPLIFPSLNLLSQWHFEHGVINEKTWDQTFSGIRPNQSHIDGVIKGIPDPNNDRSQTAIRYWLNFSDFYQWPHITYFESTDDLIDKLARTDFRLISKRMKEYNTQLSQNLIHKWKSILENIKRYSQKFQPS